MWDARKYSGVITTWTTRCPIFVSITWGAEVSVVLCLCSVTFVEGTAIRLEEDKDCVMGVQYREKDTGKINVSKDGKWSKCDCNALLLLTSYSLVNQA